MRESTRAKKSAKSGSTRGKGKTAGVISEATAPKEGSQVTEYYIDANRRRPCNPIDQPYELRCLLPDTQRVMKKGVLVIGEHPPCAWGNLGTIHRARYTSSSRSASRTPVSLIAKVVRPNGDAWRDPNLGPITPSDARRMIQHEATVMSYLAHHGLSHLDGPIPAFYGLYETNNLDEEDGEKRMILLLEDVGVRLNGGENDKWDDDTQ